MMESSPLSCGAVLRERATSAPPPVVPSPPLPGSLPECTLGSGVDKRVYMCTCVFVAEGELLEEVSGSTCTVSLLSF